MSLTPKEYTKRVREQLKLTNTRVRKWMDWCDDDIYEAFSETRQVVIPKPIDDWSFLVALHEIGHISTGERQYSYLQEYNAEKWAIKRAKEHYGIENPEYVEDAKIYVKNHLISNVIQNRLQVSKVKSYVLDWVGETQESLLALVEQALLETSVAN